MPAYYFKKAFEILRYRGPRELAKRTFYFLTNIAQLPGHIYAGYQVKKKNTSDKSDNLPKVIEISPKKISWKTSLSRKRLPPTDGRVKKKV